MPKSAGTDLPVIGCADCGGRESSDPPSMATPLSVGTYALLKSGEMMSLIAADAEAPLNKPRAWSEEGCRWELGKKNLQTDRHVILNASIPRAVEAASCVAWKLRWRVTQQLMKCLAICTIPIRGAQSGCWSLTTPRWASFTPHVIS